MEAPLFDVFDQSLPEVFQVEANVLGLAFDYVFEHRNQVAQSGVGVVRIPRLDVNAVRPVTVEILWDVVNDDGF